MITNGARCHSRCDAVGQRGRAPLHNGRSEGQTHEYASVTYFCDSLHTDSIILCLKVGPVNTSEARHTSGE